MSLLHQPLTHWGTSFAKKFDLTHCNTILDVGCRQGHITAELAKHYHQQRFVGLDNQEEAIAKATEKKLNNLDFEVGDALSFPYHHDFDAVVSFNCLLWIKDKQKALHHIYQALKPGGKAFLQLFVLHGRPKNDRFLYQTALSDNWQSYFRNFAIDYYEITLAELNALLQNEGFIIHRMEFAQYETHFDNSEFMREWMGSWASHKNAVPLKKRTHFMQATIDAYLEYYQHKEDKPFPYYEYLLEVICEKPDLHTSSRPLTYQYTDFSFTSREAFVLKHFLLGETAKEIALHSDISAKTVEFHLAKIKEKLHCHRRSEIYQAAVRHGFINLIFDNKLEEKK